MQSYTCPNCGAPVKMDEYGAFLECPYCGSQFKPEPTATEFSDHANVDDQENPDKIEIRTYEEIVDSYLPEFTVIRFIQKALKHPLITCVILFLILVSCMGGSSSSTSTIATSSYASSTTQKSGPDTSIITKYHYDYCFMHIGAENSRHYWLIDLNDKVTCNINSYSKTAYVFKLSSRVFGNGVTVDSGSTIFYFYSKSLKDGVTIKYGDDGPYDFEPVDIQLALTDLSEVKRVGDYTAK